MAENRHFNNRAYFGDHVRIGTAASDTSNLKLDVQGNMAVRDTSKLYFGVTTDNYNSWRTSQYSSGSTHIFSAQTFVFNNVGYGSVEHMRMTSSGDMGINVTSPGAKLDVGGDIRANQGKILIKRGTGLTTTIIEDDSTANGRAQLLLDSHYSDLIVASRNANTNKHGSTITLATQSTSTNDYAKWVLGQGQYQEGADILAFAYGTNQTNPHSILGTDNANAAMLLYSDGTLEVKNFKATPEGGVGSSLSGVSSIAFRSVNNTWTDANNHGITSRNHNNDWADSISINSYNDITLRLDSNSNNDSSYLRIMNNTTGNNVGSWFGYNGTIWKNRLWGNVGIDTEPRDDSYRLALGGSVHMGNANIHYTNEVHFNSGTRFINEGNNYLRFRSDSTTSGGIKLYDGGNSLKGYGMYWDGSGNGVLNSAGSWGIRLAPGNSTTSLYHTGSEKLRTESYGARTFGSHRVSDNLYLDVNYGSSIVGAYSASRYQGVFAMGDAYKLSIDGTSPGTLYGIAWTHQNVGGESISGLGHQMLVMSNGDTRSAIGDGIWTKYNLTVLGNSSLGDADGDILTSRGQRAYFGGGNGWDAVGATAQTNIHFQGHNQFWIGAGNGTWFAGTANTKNQSTGLAADANVAHDLLLTTMQSTSTYDRGITFGVDDAGSGNSGWRLGKWHSGISRTTSLLAIDGQLFAKGGQTDEFDYYADDYSSYHDNGTANWSGQSGWHKPAIVASSALQIQSGNNGTNTRKPQIQFHQYGYGGPIIEYDGPNKTMLIGETDSTERLKFIQFKLDGLSTGLRMNHDQIWRPGAMLHLQYSDSNNVSIANGGGNVGIGTTSPTTGRLVVAGGSRTGLRVDVNSGYNAIEVGGTGNIRVDFPSNAGGRFVVQENGNVGIGNSTPSTKLHVNGTTAGEDILAVDGVNGRLFTVTDDLTDSLFSVNTIAGLPIIEAFADQSIKLGPFTAPVEVTSTGELKVDGGTDLGTAITGATVSNDTITFTRANGGTFAVTTSDADSNTWRPVDDTPVDGNTTTSISSNWAFDNVKTAVPANAVFTDNNTQRTDAEIRDVVSEYISAGPNISFNVTDTIFEIAADDTQRTDAEIRDVVSEYISAGPNISFNVTDTIFEIAADDTTYSVGDGGLTQKNFTAARAAIVDTFTRNPVSGNLGIGTTDPQNGKLVISNGGTGELQFLPLDATSKTRILSYDQTFGSYIGAAYDGLSHTFRTSNTDRLVVDTNGISISGTVIASGDITAFSDARVKENVETISKALESVKEMRGVTYNKIGEEKQSLGVIAQEIEKIMPQVVYTDEEGMKSVAYGNITAVLIEAIKEQQKQIDELKAKLDGLTD